MRKKQITSYHFRVINLHDKSLPFNWLSQWDKDCFVKSDFGYTTNAEMAIFVDYAKSKVTLYDFTIDKDIERLNPKHLFGR